VRQGRAVSEGMPAARHAAWRTRAPHTRVVLWTCVRAGIRTLHDGANVHGRLTRSAHASHPSCAATLCTSRHCRPDAPQPHLRRDRRHLRRGLGQHQKMRRRRWGRPRARRHGRSRPGWRCRTCMWRCWECRSARHSRSLYACAGHGKHVRLPTHAHPHGRGTPARPRARARHVHAGVRLCVSASANARFMRLPRAAVASRAARRAAVGRRGVGMGSARHRTAECAAPNPHSAPYATSIPPPRVPPCSPARPVVPSLARPPAHRPTGQIKPLHS
jgi:hypothetical protein